MSDYSFKESDLEIDEAKVKKLIRRIIVAESKNIKSEEKNDMQMVRDIKSMIEEEVKCY